MLRTCRPASVFRTYWYFLGRMKHIAVIGAVSLNLLTGYCGQISLGHGAFVGVGAYATAWFARHGVPFFPALLAGGAVSSMVGMIFGLPSLRLKGIYLAIATLAAQLILEYVFLHWDAVTGGLHGVPVAYTSAVWHPRFITFDGTSRQGWKNPRLMVQFARDVTDFNPLTTFRLIGEQNIGGEQRGFARFGADFWPVTKNKWGEWIGRGGWMGRRGRMVQIGRIGKRF
jgi:branched-subunit amino acid ABC-type transport system permease component